MINTRQRFDAWREAAARRRAVRGSMTWSVTKGNEYLLRSSYDKSGHRRQTSLGVRGPDTERLKAEFDVARHQADARLDALGLVLARQAAVNRALELGRVPLLGARILRSLDEAGLLGAGLRIIGTYALFAYEAVVGVRVETELLTTEDVDLLLDSRSGLAFVAAENVEDASLLRLLRRVDRSFERAPQTFRAVNQDGFIVDLIKPVRSPPWTDEPTRLGADPSDLEAVEIAGLAWHESAPPFEATVVDARGEPLRLVTSDPRVFAAHKLWIAGRPDREPVKRRRDAAQAAAVAALVATHMPHLPYAADELRMLPLEVYRAAKLLFGPTTVTTLS